MPSLPTAKALITSQIELFLRWKKHYGSANSYTWSSGSAWCGSSPVGFKASIRALKFRRRSDIQQTAPDAALHIYR